MSDGAEFFASYTKPAVTSDPPQSPDPIGVWPGKEASRVIRVRDFRSPVITTLRVA